MLQIVTITGKICNMVNVKFFSSLREYVGHSDIELAMQSPLTVSEIWRQTTANKAMPPNTLCAINMEYAQLDDSVKDNDEVAFFPPVTGG